MRKAKQCIFLQTNREYEILLYLCRLLNKAKYYEDKESY